MNRIRELAVAAASAALLLSATAASAMPIVYSFESVSGIGGSVTWTGNVGAGLIGSNITVNTIERNDVATTVCTSCLLNITSGAYTSGTGDLTFAGGGSFQITGTFNGFTGVLASGAVGGAFFQDGNGVLGATFSDLETSFVAGAVQSFFGDLPELGPFFTGFTEISFGYTRGTVGSTGRRSITSTSIADMDTHLNTADMPAPATLGLLGVGLLGLAATRRRRRA